jgi:hypothetical protein
MTARYAYNASLFPHLHSNWRAEHSICDENGTERGDSEKAACCQLWIVR